MIFHGHSSLKISFKTILSSYLKAISSIIFMIISQVHQLVKYSLKLIWHEYLFIFQVIVFSVKKATGVQ